MAAAPERGCLAAGWRGAPLSAKDLRLRPFAPADEAALVALAGEEEIARWTADVPHPYRPEDARAFIADVIRRFDQGGPYAFAVERLRDKTLIGAAGVRPDDDRHGEVGYWIGMPFWGRGYATQAVRRLARFAFADLGLDRLSAGVLPGNAASERVLEKAGFSYRHDGFGGRGRCADQPHRFFQLDRAAWAAADAARPVVLVAAVALIDADGRVLVAKRPEGKSMAGLWELPGGKVAPGETPEAALIRELAEELGLDVTESCLAPLVFASHAYEDFHLLMPVYACRVWQGAPAAREGQELAWVRPARLADLPMPPADVPLVALLRDFLGG